MTLFANPVAHRIAFELRPFLTRSRLMYGAVVGGGRNGSPRAWDPPGLVGRAAELAELDAFLNTAAAPARALVLAGGAGVGKTSLWEAAVESARERGLVVLSARPTASETQLSYAAMADLFAGVDEAVFAALPAPQRDALDVALLRSEPSDPPPEARAIAAAFLGVLRDLAARLPLLVAIDDVQWLDAESAAALSFARRRLDDTLIAFLLTERTNGETIRIESGDAQRVDVGGLSVAETRALLLERSGFHPSRSLLRRIFESAGGNPFFTLELARMLEGRDEPLSLDQPLPVPTELGALLRQRLDKLPDASKTAALGAALTAEPSTALVEALVGDAAATSLKELHAAGVVETQGDRIRFTHPLMASTVVALALPGQRRAMQHTLANVVDDPVTRARHLALATDEPEEEVARALEAAARLAAGRGGWDAAAELLERARDLTPPEHEPEARQRTIAAAEYHVHAGDRARARAMLEEVLGDALPRADRANALRLLAEISRDDANFEGAISVYEQALEFVDDAATEVAIEMGLAYVCASSWQLADAVDHAYRALDLVGACNDDALTAAALAVCAMVDWQFGRGAAWDKVEKALALENLDVVMPLPERPSAIAALLHLYTGNHAEARLRLNEIWTRLADQGDQSNLAFILTWFSWLETRAANLDAAASLADEAESLGALTSSESARAHALGQRAYVHAYEGDVEHARALAAEATAAGERVGYLLPALWGCATIALLELSLGNAQAAWDACAQITALVEANGVGEPVLVLFLPDAIEALIGLGELDRAEPLAWSLERRGRELDGTWAIATGARCRGLLLAARGDLVGAERVLADALIEHKRLDMPLERARTLLVQGIVARRAKHRAQARASLGEACEEFERFGARLWAERAREELTRVSGRRPSRTLELTPTEQRVAELAAHGMSNREIADSLFVTVHTVESHLSHVYQKLGVRSRSQLAAKLAGPG